MSDQLPCPQFLKDALAPVHRLYERLDSKDRPDLWLGAIDRTCTVLGVKQPELAQRFADPLSSPAIIEELHAQSFVLIEERLSRLAEKARLGRLMAGYVNRPEISQFKAVQTGNEDVLKSAVRSAITFMCEDDGIAEEDLEGKLQPTFNYHVSAYVFAAQQKKRRDVLESFHGAEVADEVVFGELPPLARQNHNPKP